MRKILTIMLALAIATPALAANYISYNFLERDGVPAETQTRFETGMALELLNGDYFWDQATLRGEYTLVGTGYLEEDSAPFSTDHQPATYLRRVLNKTASVDYGWLHGSNGESGEESRSWNRQFARLNLDYWWGNFRGIGSVTAWEAFDVGENSEFLTELRGAGGSNFGFEGEGQVVWKDDVLVSGQFAKNMAFAGIGFNPTPGPNSYFVMVGGMTGKGQNLGENDSPERQLFVGLALAPGD